MSSGKGIFGGGIPQALMFPSEVGTDEVPNFVTFRPVEIDFGQYGSNGSSAASHGNAFSAKNKTWNPAGTFTTGLASQAKSGIGGIIDNVANGALSALNSLGKGLVNFSGDIDLFGGALTARVDIGSLGLSVGDYSQSNTIRKLPGINLYMPPDLATQLSGNYAQAELGAMGQTAINMVDTNAFTRAGPESSAGMVAGDLFTDAGKLFSGMVNDVFRTGKLGQVAQRATGRAFNNYSYAIFNGMKHRDFNYSFRMVAKDERESIMIKSICDQFMLWMLPTKSTDNFHQYTVPAMWEISYNNQTGKNEFLDQPNSCFLKDVSIKYNTVGQGLTYNSGAPIDVTLSLSFMEIEPLYNNESRGNTEVQEGNSLTKFGLSTGNTSGGAG